jgi:hypothetical protein
VPSEGAVEVTAALAEAPPDFAGFSPQEPSMTAMAALAVMRAMKAKALLDARCFGWCSIVK